MGFDLGQVKDLLICLFITHEKSLLQPDDRESDLISEERPFLKDMMSKDLVPWRS